MRPKVRLFVWAVALLLAVSAVAACSGEQQPETLVVVLVDVSASTAAAREQYLQTFERVLQNVPDGGRLVLLPVDANSSVNPIAADVVIPKLQLSLDPGAGNERMQKERRAAAIAKAQEAMVRLLDSDRAPVPGTAIVAAVGYADRIFSAVPDADHYLVVISDMIEQSEYDFTRLTAAEVDGLLTRLKDQHRIPSMQASVYMAGITAGNAPAFRISDDQLRAIESFWTRFFQEAGADVKWYGPTLLEFCVKGRTCST